MATSTYDVIVLGLGGIGSAALYHLARRGARALGIEQFGIAHDRGSSHGQTRIIRQAYFEHPDYVPLLRRAYVSWAELEAECGQKLFHQVGLLQVGPPRGEVLSGVLASATRHRLDVERLSAREIETRWPGFRVAEAGAEGVFERRAGYLEVEKCVAAHFEAARRSGAAAILSETVRTWNAANEHISVRTDRAEFGAQRLVITAGAWAPPMLQEVGIPFQVLRKAMFWFQPGDASYDPACCPCFLFETAEGEFYGFPRLAPHGVKVAEHTGGQVVGDPAHVSRELDDADLRRVRDFVDRNLSALGNRPAHHAVCLYTMSPDRHFVVDRHPRHENVFYVAGLSGHGFKFAPVLGQALAELALEGKTNLEIDFLAAGRLRPRG